MTDLVVRTRVEVARQSLDRVHKLLETISGNEGGLETFLSLPESLGDKVDRLTAAGWELRRGVRSSPGGPAGRGAARHQLDANLRELDADLGSASDELKELRRQAARL